MHIQRVGRAGRLAPGVAYPLYTEETYNKFIKEEYPDIIKSNINGHLLNLIVKICDPQGLCNQHSTWDLLCGQIGKDLKFMETNADTKFNIYEYDLMDLPSADAINGAINRLYILGALTSNCTPTPIGLIMNRFGLLSIEASKIILAGYAWKAPIIDLIIIGCLVSFINANDLYSRRGDPYNRKLHEGVFNIFGSKNSYLKTQLMLCCDLLMFVIVWSEFQKYSSRYLNDNDIHIIEWCKEHGLEYGVLSEMISYRDDTIEMLSKIGLDPYANFNSSYLMTDSMNIDHWIQVMKQCIFEGFKCNIAVWDTALKCYTTKHGRLSIPVNREWIAPMADIMTYNSSNPKYILYTDILFRQKFMDNTYDSTVNYVSAISGFIPFDPDFDIIRNEDLLIQQESNKPK
jgi:HrpA-like RNA helicase